MECQLLTVGDKGVFLGVVVSLERDRLFCTCSEALFSGESSSLGVQACASFGLSVAVAHWNSRPSRNRGPFLALLRFFPSSVNLGPVGIQDSYVT